MYIHTCIYMCIYIYIYIYTHVYRYTYVHMSKGTPHASHMTRRIAHRTAHSAQRTAQVTHHPSHVARDMTRYRIAWCRVAPRTRRIGRPLWDFHHPSEHGCSRQPARAKSLSYCIGQRATQSSQMQRELPRQMGWEWLRQMGREWLVSPPRPHPYPPYSLTATSRRLSLRSSLA